MKAAFSSDNLHGNEGWIERRSYLDRDVDSYALRYGQGTKFAYRRHHP
jgi:hypothetical protein